MYNFTKISKFNKWKRGLVTEILKRENIHEYIDNDKIHNFSLEKKFELAYEKGLISADEKEKWGY